MSTDVHYDVFLSHSSKDKSVVRVVAERLRSDGLRVWFDEWEILPGDYIPAKIDDGLERSRVLLFCMSESAFGADWPQLEAGTFRFRDPLNKDRRFVPLRIDQTPIKTAFVPFRYIRWLPEDREQEYGQLLAALRRAAHDASEATSEPVAPLPRWLTIPTRMWKGSPSALLRADHAVVPFHGREYEMEEWKKWALSDGDPAVRLLTGSGGMGKTRLARELCLQLRHQGVKCGFLNLADSQECLSHFKFAPDESTLLVVDYAETAAEVAGEILKTAANRDLTKLRVLLLARGAGYWWTRLKRTGGGVGDWLRHEPERLRPLALDIEARRDSFHRACYAFAQKLGKKAPTSEPLDFGAVHYERTLLLHMSALLSIEGIQANGMDPILESMLGREIANWSSQLRQRQLPQFLEPGFERAMGIISACGGVRDKQEAVGIITKIRFFQDQPQAMIEAIAETLHDCFQGTTWIEPIQPDLLMEYLVAKATDDGPDDFDNIVVPK